MLNKAVDIFIKQEENGLSWKNGAKIAVERYGSMRRYLSFFAFYVSVAPDQMFDIFYYIRYHLAKTRG
jgi:hypothetical protein